ncbi:GNAT family N-acetyltransferase [Pseudarthrobacter sp. NPDC058362]|uniref:GNAT family N-acetyltransferase n=1 Tax=Pseudarthrobacter sp. NPDC058362 TaxID=3346458 RepID=UPI003650F290
MPHSPDVSLVDVDDVVMESLLALARRDASPDEVAPPLGGPGWNAERTAWFRSHHRAAADGLDGPAGEKTWAVLCDGEVAGSVRLKRVDAPGPRPAGETGIWLGRSYRSSGIGGTALKLLLAEARRAGLAQVLARTLSGNRAAQHLLSGLGAPLTEDDDGTVLAAVVL